MNSVQDLYLLDCATYDDYLDLFITRSDLKYLRNIRFSRMLVELGYRSTNEILSPEQFKIRKQAAYEYMFPIKKSLILFHNGIIIDDPVLLELSYREKLNYQKVVSTIIFLRYRYKSGFEISGYIDFESSLRKRNLKTYDSTDWKAVFEKRKILRPKPSDLSFHNSRTNTTYYNDSDNYMIINDPDEGLAFMHKGDRKKVYINKDSGKVMVYSSKYGQVIFYDHVIRRKV